MNPYLLSIGLVLAACGSHASDDMGGTGHDAAGSGRDGSAATLDAQACGTLHAVIRDFQIAHPDFEVTPANDVVVTGLVEPTLPLSNKPVLSATPPAAGLITSPTTFADWYTDVNGTNMRFEQDLVLTENPPGVFVYDTSAYFPIDNRGFGNEGNPHNYHFTTELHATFKYTGGEKFTFRGDDDVWVFIHGKLAIDLGGVHSAKLAAVDLDARAAELGLTIGQSFAIDFFQAERHVTGSNFRIETSIDCFNVVIL